MKHPTKTLAALAVTLGLGLAPAAHAQSRDTGIGQVIAAQGNAALELIRSEVRDAIQAWRPTAIAPARKPEQVRVQRRSADATGAGLPDSANCAP